MCKLLLQVQQKFVIGRMRERMAATALWLEMLAGR